MRLPERTDEAVELQIAHSGGRLARQLTSIPRAILEWLAPLIDHRLEVLLARHGALQNVRHEQSIDASCTSRHRSGAEAIGLVTVTGAPPVMSFLAYASHSISRSLGVCVGCLLPWTRGPALPTAAIVLPGARNRRVDAKTSLVQHAEVTCDSRIDDACPLE